MFKLFKRFDFLLAAALVVHLVALRAMHTQARQARQAELEEARQALAAQRLAALHEKIALDAACLRMEIDLARDLRDVHRESMRAELKVATEAWERGEDRAAAMALFVAREEFELWRKRKELLLGPNPKKE